MVPWRQVQRRYPHVTLLSDRGAYADVFDAIEEARGRAGKWEPSPTEHTTLAELTGSDDPILAGFSLCQVPVVPVKVPNTVRLCVGLLQYGLWQEAVDRNEGWPSGRRVEALLPDVGVLLGRKLRPTAEEGADLARFLCVPEPKVGEGGYREPLSPLLRMLEKCFEPPAPAPMRAPLEEAKRRVRVACDQFMAFQRFSKGRGTTKRYDQWVARIDRLLGADDGKQ